MSSINVDLDFQDYTPTTSQGNVRSDTTRSGATTATQRVQQPEVQVRIPISTDNFKQNIQNAASVLNVLQNVANQHQESTTSNPAGLSGEAMEQLVWLSGRQKSKQHRAASSSWGLGYFAQYFDVTVDDVLQRILWSAVPVRKTGLDLDEMNESELTTSLTSDTVGDPSDSSEINTRLYEQLNRTKRKHYSYIERFIQSRPDFYGPFWICTTLIFAVAIFSNIVSFKRHRAKVNQIDMLQANNNLTDSSSSSLVEEMQEWHYSIDELNATASCVMFYMGVVPTLLWFLFWFRGCAKYYTLNETICAYGYSLSIFIPLTILLMIQATPFRYLAISFASLLSGLVLVMSFLPIIQSDPNKGGSYIFLILIPVCHFSFAYILHRIMLQ